ncbi:MAG: type II toxin-antitoxin system RelE family toxin [Chthoniobacterales bacterium]
MMKVELSEQVADYVARQAPDGRKILQRALRKLESEQGDIKALEERLDGFHRLRVGPYRVIFRYVRPANTTELRCEFAERRRIIYEAYERMVASRGNP